MGAALFLPAILQMIPSLIGIFGKGDRAQQNAKAAETVVNAFVAAVPGAANAQDAIEKAQTDPVVKAQAVQAVVSDPTVMALMEVGGGVAAARDYDLKVQQAQKPFWQASAVFWVSVLLLPLVYWLVGSLIVGGILDKFDAASVDVPAWMRLILSMFGNAWNGESRSGGFNLVIGLVLGGICGVYFGVSVTQGRAQGQTGTTQP